MTHASSPESLMQYQGEDRHYSNLLGLPILHDTNEMDTSTSTKEGSPSLRKIGHQISTDMKTLPSVDSGKLRQYFGKLSGKQNTDWIMLPP